MIYEVCSRCHWVKYVCREDTRKTGILCGGRPSVRLAALGNALGIVAECMALQGLINAEKRLTGVSQIEREGLRLAREWEESGTVSGRHPVIAGLRAGELIP